MKAFLFFWEVKNRVVKNDLVTYANSLTFKLILAIFPFIIALLAFLGFLSLPTEKITYAIVLDMPKEIGEMMSHYISEVLEKRSISLLSSSAIIAIYSASAGFHTMIKGVCNCYDINENRGFFKTRLIGLLLMLLFVFVIIAILYIVIFWDIINSFLIKIGVFEKIPHFITTLVTHSIVAVAIVIFLVSLYKFAISIKLKIKCLLPGVFFTIISWFIVSKLFNIYISNFSKYSVIYGSIGAIFVFGIWLFLLSFLILMGAQINAIINDKKFMEEIGIKKG